MKVVRFMYFFFFRYIILVLLHFHLNETSACAKPANDSAVSLTRCGFKELPFTDFGGDGPLLTAIQSIDLSFNEIKTIKNLSFARAKNLKTLDLSSNKLDCIENAAFHELNTLKKLKIHKNKLTVLDWILFEKNIELIVLDVSENSLRRIDRNNKNDLSIQELDIYNNSLEDISQVRELPQLKILHMGHNCQMKFNASTFEKNLAMKSLFLTSTNLAAIENFEFLINMPELTYLNLMENNLEKKMKILPVLPKLAHFNVRRTNLKTFDFLHITSKFPSLKEINLLENKFLCTCLEDMLAFLADQKIKLNCDYSMFRPNSSANIKGVQCINNSIENYEYLKTQNQKLREQLIYANLIKITAMATAFVISIFACVCSVCIVSRAKKTMQQKENIYEEPQNEYSVNLRTANPDETYETISEPLEPPYDELRWPLLGQRMRRSFLDSDFYQKLTGRVRESSQMLRGTKN
jgi:hypothetical protein